MDTQTSQDVKKRIVKAVWNKNVIMTFCDVSIQAIQKGMRPTTHFTPEGWNFIGQNFTKETGFVYEKKILKNKWDLLKKDWKIWKELIGKETGLGWDPKKKTIDAPSEWWDAKLRVIANAGKFRKEGIDPDLEARMDMMYGDTVATGEFAWTPSSNDIQNSNHNVEQLSDEDDIEQGSNGDSVEDFQESLNDYMQSGNTSLNNTPLEVEKSSKKQKGNDGCSLQSNAHTKGRKSRKNLGGAAKLRGDISRLVDAVESRNAKIIDTGMSLSDIMIDVESLSGISKDKDLYYFAAYLFEQKPKREGYAIMKTPEEKLGWLKFQYQMVKGKPAD